MHPTGLTILFLLGTYLSSHIFCAGAAITTTPLRAELVDPPSEPILQGTPGLPLSKRDHTILGWRFVYEALDIFLPTADASVPLEALYSAVKAAANAKMSTSAPQESVFQGSFGSFVFRMFSTGAAGAVGVPWPLIATIAEVLLLSTQKGPQPRQKLHAPTQGLLELSSTS